MTDTPTPLADPPPDGRHVCVTTQVRAWVADALRSAALGDRVTYDVTFALTQSPAGPVPTVMVFLQIASAIIGQPLGHVFALPLHQATEATIRATVAEVMGALFQQRQQSATAGPFGAGHLN